MEKYLIFDEYWDRNLLSKRFEGTGLIVLHPSGLTEKLLAWDGWSRFNPEKTLLVFPGNGSKGVLERIDNPYRFDWLSKWPWRRTVSAKRIWIPGSHPEAYAGRISPGVFVGFKDVVVIDDVVSSGATAKKIWSVNYPFLPSVRWHIVAWVGQRARQIKPFASSFFGIEVGDEKSKAPLNSLSTFRKDRAIAESYAARNFSNPQDFLDLLDPKLYSDRSPWELG